MKNFWHMQMHQGEPNSGIEERILKEKSMIGMGHWEEAIDQQGKFEKVMKEGDIVAIKSGEKLIALTEVTGPYEYSDEVGDPDWFNRRRKVKILEWYKPEYNLYVSPRATLTRCNSDGDAASTKSILNWYNMIMKNSLKNESISLLKYKKQIILQGPPGTGKTRLAKEIAKELLRVELPIISKRIEDIINRHIVTNAVIPMQQSNKAITVTEVNDENFKIRISTGKVLSQTKRSIADVLASQNFNRIPGDSYPKAIALYLNKYLNLNDDDYKLIQFHPAYSYEDFVRGIIVETEGGNPSYRSINKIFAELAEAALQNYNDSQKQPEVVSKEKLLERYLNDFKEDLATKIDESDEGKLMLQGTSIYLFQVEEDAVRYVGDNWKRHSAGLRLLFSDIKTLYLSDAKNRKDVTANSNISSLSRSHASYTLRVLDLFKAFMNGKSLVVNHQQKIEEIPFVLIIDEINRANLPSVLGELIYGLEYRGKPIESMYEVDGDRKIIIPPNLYVIGTMNTADRSVGHIDYAIRRRFAFVDVLPTIDPIKNELAKAMFEKVSKLFVANYTEVIQSQASPKRASTLLSDFRPEDVWIGHSYFLTSKEGEMGNNEIKIKMKYEVLPLLKEYVKDGILRSNEESSDDTVQMVLKELNGV